MRSHYPFFIAMRYLKSRRKQKGISFNTLISIGGVTLGVMTLIVVLSVMSGFSNDLQKKILGVNAHAVVLSSDGAGIADYNGLAGKLAKEPHIKSASPFVLGQAMVSFDKAGQGVFVRGIEPSREETVTDLQKHMKEGSLDALSNTTGMPGIILGSELAGTLGVYTGDTVKLISPAAQMGPLGMIPKMREFKVVGIFDIGMYEYDANLAVISMKAAQDFFSMDNRATGVELKVDDIYKAPEIRRKLENELGGAYFVRDWIEMNHNLFSALKLEKLTMFVILTLIIIVASFNIVSTLIMIVIEKQREIAILKAMGATSKGIMAIFVIQGFIIGVAGTALGLLGSFGIGKFIQTSPLAKLPPDVYYLSHLPVVMNPRDFVVTAAAALLISLSATIYPAWQAAKVDPVEPLRYQ
ncbi:MAG: lipoprotein-releasing ABC transporter permease subunit [Nitrospiraceae bacterium]|nr:lipoprotein-releasing ABC transporter permease subunit [Nitrospiraceae bacterium]